MYFLIPSKRWQFVEHDPPQMLCNPSNFQSKMGIEQSKFWIFLNLYINTRSSSNFALPFCCQTNSDMGMHHNSNLLDYRFWPFFWHEPSIFVGPNDLTHTPSIPPGESETSELSQTVAEFAAKLLGTAGLRSFSAWKKWGAGGDGRLR